MGVRAARRPGGAGVRGVGRGCDGEAFGVGGSSERRARRRWVTLSGFEFDGKMEKVWTVVCGHR